MMMLGRRVRRLEGQQGDARWLAVPDDLIALVAAGMDVPVAALRAQTVELLAQAQQQGVRTVEELATMVATEGGYDPVVVLAEAEALVARWRGAGR